MTDDARKVVLARRARFVAAALAGIGVACGKSNKPEPCLSIATTGPEAPPGPCLSVPMRPADGGSTPPAEPDAGDPDAGGPDAGNPDAGGKKPTAPQPCLKIAPPDTSPRPCLTPKKP